MHDARSDGAGRRDDPSLDLLHPLDHFYARMQAPLPAIRRIEADVIPEPYRQLLAHRNDMTPTLQAFHGGRLWIRPLARRRRGNEYLREVLLLLEGSNQPVEFGAIKIHLDRVTEEARRAILDERRPLGQILAECEIAHSSRPRAFLEVRSDPVLEQALGLTGSTMLYGRRNTLYDQVDRPLAEIVEILPPVLSPTA